MLVRCWLDKAAWILSTPVELRGWSLMCNRLSPHGVYLRWKSLGGAVLMLANCCPVALNVRLEASCSFLKIYPQFVIFPVELPFPLIKFVNKLICEELTGKLALFDVKADKDRDLGVETLRVDRLSVAALILILVNSSST